jgi:hypothetical protein
VTFKKHLLFLLANILLVYFVMHSGPTGNEVSDATLFTAFLMKFVEYELTIFLVNLVIASSLLFWKILYKKMSGLKKRILVYILSYPLALLFVFLEIFTIHIFSGINYRLKSDNINSKYAVSNIKVTEIPSTGSGQLYDGLNVSYSLSVPESGTYRIFTSIVDKNEPNLVDLFRNRDLMNKNSYEKFLTANKAQPVTAFFMPLNIIQNRKGAWGPIEGKNGPYVVSVQIAKITNNDEIDKSVLTVRFIGDKTQTELRDNTITVFNQSLITPVYKYTDFRVPEEIYDWKSSSYLYLYRN